MEFSAKKYDDVVILFKIITFEQSKCLKWNDQHAIKYCNRGYIANKLPKRNIKEYR